VDLALLAGAWSLLQKTGSEIYWASLPIAVLMLRNVSLMHEAVHGLAHPQPRLNYVFGLIAGSLCLLPFHLWKKIHMEHHFWAGNYNRDPSLEIIKRYPQISNSQKRLLDLTWKTRVPLMAFAQYMVFWSHSLVNLLKSPKEWLLWVNMFIPFAIWSGALSQLQGRQIGVVGVAIFAYLVVFEVINFPHHVGLYLEDSETAKLPLWKQYEVTRTSRYPKFLEKFLVLNFNYHAEHHMFPDLPWHQLPKAHALIQGSEIQPNTHVVHAPWLEAKRNAPFSGFLRPDLKPEPETNKANKKAA
jgi:fatty acid desaturase